MDGGYIGALAVLLIFGTPIVAILSHHQRKVLEIKLRLRQTADQGVLDEIRKMQAQIDKLRDTTTQYDVSFDNALQHVSERVGNLEARIGSIERASSSAPQSFTSHQ